MKYEVEQKFPISDITAVEVELTSFGVEISPPRLEVDVYFAHPARNFAETDVPLPSSEVRHFYCNCCLGIS